jgi:hypothetical protein
MMTVQVLASKQRKLMEKMNLSKDEYKKQYPNKAKTLKIFQILAVLMLLPAVYFGFWVPLRDTHYLWG